MKNVLFINGCVRAQNSNTLKIAQTYIEELRKNHDINVIERNLSQENMTFLTDKSFNSNGELYTIDKSYALEFANADEIIIAAPFWEFLFPAIVNCYLEMISIVGITFKYSDCGSVGLCKANSLTYIYTSGDNLQEEDKVSELYLKRLSKLFGIKTFSAFSAQGLDIITNNADEIVQNTCDKICSFLK